jgi:hypothetical protein
LHVFIDQTTIGPPPGPPRRAAEMQEDTSEAGSVDLSSIRAPPPTRPPRPAPEKPRSGQVSRCCNVA